MYRKGWLKGADRVFISVKDEAKYLNKIIRIRIVGVCSLRICQGMLYIK